MRNMTRFKKSLCTTLVLFLLVAVFAPAALAASDKQLVPIGSTVGITLETEGVMVVGYSDETASPAASSGIMPGDMIVAVGDTEISSAEDIKNATEGLDGSAIALTVLRGDVKKQYTVTPNVLPDGTAELGLWLRDSLSGIGTVTFFDPDTGTFGALGHPVSDVDTGVMVPVRSGKITASDITEVIQGKCGTPGQLMGVFDLGCIYGNISTNNICGIFGNMSNQSLCAGKTAIDVAPQSEIHTGSATILSNISGSETVEYTIEVTRVYSGPDAECRNMMIKVTDPDLLAATGGIVQGMSGSPIIQDGKIIGAVTHVLVNDPTKGYGISIEKMLNAA